VQNIYLGIVSLLRNLTKNADAFRRFGRAQNVSHAIAPEMIHAVDSFFEGNTSKTVATAMSVRLYFITVRPQ
jgi:hypothetical protein